jgi:tetratricopeptide (TPR) repeat protein
VVWCRRIARRVGGALDAPRPCARDRGEAIRATSGKAMTTAIRDGVPREELSAREKFERGRALFEDGDHDRALPLLRAAHASEGHDARIRSWYGLCVGLVDRRFEEAVTYCLSAAKQEFFNPDLYWNLARLHLGFGFKSEGIRYLRRGLMIDPGNAPIAEELRRLGYRRPPVLAFLRRQHALNRWLGRLRFRTSEERGQLEPA